jgi:branched-subunit amino acid transport protein
MTWTAIFALAIGTFAMKAVGPVVIGRRELSRRLYQGFLLIAAALLAALIAVSTFISGSDVNFDWPLIAGVAAAAIAIWRKAPLVVVIVLAAAVAALLRAVT